MLAAAGGVCAQEDAGVKELITPDSSISVGVGVVNNTQDAKRFGQYTGMNQGAAYGLIDFDWVMRDDATGTWATLLGRDLGLDTREVAFSQQRQGEWKYKFDYNEIVRNDPYVIHTGMTGIGTTTPTVNLIALPAMPAAWAAANAYAPSNGVAGSDVELKIKRTALGISGEKRLTPELMFEAGFRSEDKKGARMFGRVGIDSSDMSLRPTQGTGGAGATGNWAMLLTPEPINSNISQFEAKMNFSRDKLALSGGYMASFYTNYFGSLSPAVPDILNRGPLWDAGAAGSSTIAQLASSAVALPPDNQAHQLYLTGNLAYSPTTHANFKLSYTHATQNDSFAAQGLTPSATAPASLGGEVNTTLAQIGLSMRPSKNLSVNASLRYEDRADRTPVSVYNTSTASVGLNNTTNWPSASQTRTSAKLDGTYRLSAGYSTILGADWERKSAPLPPANTAIFAKQVFFRPQLDEYGLHAELRKAMAEKLNGSIGIEYKQRRGNGGWVTSQAVAGNPITPVADTLNNVLADMYMDRNRAKLKGTLDWTPSDRMSLQAVLEHAQDDYLRADPVPAVPVTPGARVIVADSLTLDSSYTVTEDWRLNGYWTHSENRWNVNKVSISDDTRNYTETVGLGIKGKASSRLEVGADIMATHDTTNFNNMPAAGNIAGWNGQTLPGNFLPSIHYSTEKLNLFANYAIEKQSYVLMNIGYQHFQTDDWQWGYNGIPFLYSDNTTVSQPTSQHLLFVAARYAYKFQ
jgi:MtrB/PioB family decaheme-associated outer membrane protein